MQPIEIRDNRQKEWFWLDNEYLNGYARFLGSSCTVVYLSLCRHSDNQTQTCFPSMKLIAEENGISRDTVMRAVKKLEEWNIIKVEKSKKEDGTQANNQYTLLAKKVWKSKPSSIEQHGQPSSKNKVSRVAPEGHNNTHINKTQGYEEQEDKSSTPLKEEYNPETYLKEMKQNPDKRIKIIAWYINQKKIDISSEKKAQTVIKRNLVIAKELLAYSGTEIAKAFQRCLDSSKGDYDVTLETVLKKLTR